MRIWAFASAFAVFAASAAAATSPADDSGRVIALAELHRAVSPEAVALLDSSVPGLAARAALALGRTKRPEARAALRPRLTAPDRDLRAMAAYAEGLLLDSEALTAERQLASHDPSPAVRYAAIDAIDRIVGADPTLGLRPVADEMLAAARADRDPVVRGHAAVALTAFRASPDAAALAAGLGAAFAREPYSAVRWHEMWSLFRGFAAVAPRETLVRGLHDRADTVRIEAVRAFGRRAVASDTAVLKPLLDDPSWRVQLQTRESLRQLAKQPLNDHYKQLMPGLHLPPADAQNGEEALPRPDPAPKLGTPGADDLLAALPLSFPDAAAMDGPMRGPHPRVRIRTTKGDLVLRLFPEWAPYTVANFLRLSARGYYDGNRWFRIVPDFVVQTGDPNDNGEGDAGFAIPAEENPVEQRSGIISMGLNYDKDHPIRDSAGSQFYLTISPQPHLDRDFTVFGELESGMGTIARLIETDRIVRVDRLADR
jgi:peptidyl-prolyl cis-trans isomerase B (cyclophilin B)